MKLTLIVNAFVLYLSLLLSGNIEIVNGIITSNRLNRQSTTRLLPVMRMDSEEGLILKSGMLPRSSYIATNRFKVRDGKSAAFEKRWADRKSRLSQLEGFDFFALLKKIDASGTMNPKDDSHENYISFTVWNKKENFEAWRSGEAFKEAHGGGGIMDFVKLITTALFILDGGPKPAFWDAMLPINVGGDNDNKFKGDGGWRNIPADGISEIKPDIFVASNKFSVKPGEEVNFESRWAQRQQSLSEYPGFMRFYLARRDASKADDGINYQAISVWSDKASFDNWYAKQGTHGGGGSSSSSSSSDSNNATTKPLSESLNGPPKQAFYEGKLTLMA